MIRQVAEASGFTAATLRYYEQIGLLPEPRRTDAGYRTYDQRTLDRLAFIRRAKQLGCTLDEITELSVAWDGGRCGPVQDQLRQLVASKLRAANAQVAEIAAFTADLQQAAAALERHRPDGACDTTCGCVSAPPSDTGRAAVTIQAVSVGARPTPAGARAIACTLPVGSMTGRLADWDAVLTHVVARERIDGGVRCVFAPSVPTADLIRLVAAEQDCCQFFGFAITMDTRGVALEVVAPDDAHPILESLFGAP